MVLKDKVILVTGASGGLGTSVTRALLDAGARVVGVARTITDAEFSHPAFSARAAGISNLQSAQSVVQGVIAKCGHIDGMVHLVGGFAGGQAIHDTDDATFDRMIDLNLRGAFHLLRAVLMPMRAQNAGRIVLIGSKSAVEPAPMAAVYAASKAALVSLARTVARENSDAGVTVNIVLPGTIDTPANRVSDPAADPAKWVQPGTVASLIVHLLSDSASQINGAAIPVYGREA
jgi:NAD(P)-dependent dehydrogenase (short-subunit alcohol dehydrogenase family)